MALRFSDWRTSRQLAGSRGGGDRNTINGLCKAVDRGMTITDVKVMEKHGGKSGDWVVQS